MDNVKISRGVNYENNLSPSKNKKWELVNFCEFDKYATKSYCAIHNVDESKNLGDITKVDENKLQDFNMICGGSPCFVAGTKVYTSTGYKNIEDVKIGDMVLTHKNRYMPVVRIGGEKNKEIYSMRIQGFLNTECTNYHPFYCKKSKISYPEKIKLKDLKKGYYLGSHINNKEDNKFNLSDEDCWILGRYVADGHIRKWKRKERKNSYYYQCVLSIGDDKIEKLKSIVKTRNYSCYKHTQSTYRVVFSSMELVNFIIEHNFGIGAENKIIPNFILDLPVNKLQYFLNGYMDGDGCEINGVYQATTISKELAMSLSLAIQKVYRVGCCIYYNKRPNTYIIEGRTVKQKDTYMIRFRTKDNKHAWFIEDDIVWYPIKEIKSTNRIEDVFNIEVEEDHTYAANNIITFNCQDFSLAGKQKGSVWTCNDCTGDDGKPFEYNPLTVHWSKRDYCPNCGSKNIEKTRSSLLVEYLRVVRANKPNFGIYENVKNIVGKQFKDTTFKLFTDELEEYGYNVYWKILNAKNYGIPQNRERVYLIFIRKDLDNGKFKFPEPFDNGLRLKDMLEDEVGEKFYISEEKVKRLVTNLNNVNSLLYDPCQVKREGKSREYTEYASTLTSRDYKDPRLINDNIVKQIGNISDCDGAWSNPQVGRVYDPNGCSPTLNTCSGGGHEPKVICGCDKTYNNPRIIENANCITSREDRGISNRKQEGTAVIESNNIDKNVLKTPDISYCLDASYYKGTTVEEYLKKHRRQLVFEHNNDCNKVAVKQATKQGYIECEIGGVADLSYPSSKLRRGRVQENGNVSLIITTQTGVCKIESSIRVRKLTPRETFRLMGFSDNDFDAAAYNNQIIEISGKGDDLKRSAKLKDVIERLLQKNTEISASCIISVLQELEETSTEWMRYQEEQEKEKKKNVNIVIEKLEELEHSECAINIIKCLESTETLYGLTKEIDQHQMAIIELGKRGKRNTGKYMKITSEESLHPMKLYIILMVLELITESKIYTSLVQKVNIQGVIVNLEKCKKSTVMTQNLSLKMDIISTRVSSSQLYKQAGNSIVVDVLYYIYRELYIAMPYLFDDLKLSSFFSGIGAFESGLDRLYDDINSGNFTKPQTE